MLEKDVLLGSCVLGSSMFARGKGEEHWKQCLKFTKQHIEMWHPLVARGGKSGKGDQEHTLMKIKFNN